MEEKDMEGAMVPLADEEITDEDDNEPSLQHLPPEGVDEPDKVSVFSLFMERDFRFYFQHPIFRFIVAYLVTFCNFLIYAEDPVAHSEKECFIPVVGNCFSFVCTRYPPNAWSLLKVVLWLTAILCGIVIGKLVVHKIVLNKCFKLKMFTDGQGSWMMMFFTSILLLFIFSHIYNGFLMLGGDATIPYRISSLMGIKNTTFLKAAACGTWCGDFFTAWMVTDIMLQEKLYPKWGKAARAWWVRDYHRIILFWVITLATSTVVVMVIGTDWISWDRLNRDFLPTNEISRGFLASFILVMDLIIVMQDWDFPHFINNFDIKLPGLNTAHIKIHLPKFLRKPHWVIHITGKWFNYGIIFIVMILDLNMWKNQIFYEPFEYGQYVDPDHKVHSVRDTYSLLNFNETYFNYEWRSNNTDPLTNATYLDGDMVMNTRFYNNPLKYKALAFIPCLLAFVCFFVLIWYFGRWKPTPTDPHAGRLKRRRKAWLASARRFFSSRRRSGRSQGGSVNLTKATFNKENEKINVGHNEVKVDEPNVGPDEVDASNEVKGQDEAKVQEKVVKDSQGGTNNNKK